MSSDIDQILYPTVLSSLRQDIPPVQCIIWKGGKSYETITFNNIYPFDTIDHIKREICTYYKEDPSFIPRFLFVGVQVESGIYSDDLPTMESRYIPLDYLWYPRGTNDPKTTYVLNNPLYTLKHPDLRFVEADGSYAGPNYQRRGRSTIEDVFLKPRDGQIPTLHVYPLKKLIESYMGSKPIGEEEWNKKFAPYFPDIKVEGPYQPQEDDIEFAEKIHYFIKQRDHTVDILNRFLEEAIPVPTMKLTGIRQMLLTWKKPVKGFEGAAPLFYRVPVTEQRPYLRLLPAEGSAITKLHVKGILPIPTLDDPRVLQVWNSETTPTPGRDFCTIKYVHRPSIGITQPIYGTIQVLNDGTMNLLLQPPKQIRKLNPDVDFRNFNRILEDIFSGLPQPFNAFELKEIAVFFTLKLSIKSLKFTKKRLLDRLPIFQTFFKQIKPLPDENPIISLRYKAVSQYASENQVFTFITQLATDKILAGEAPDSSFIVAIQNEFQFSKKEAMDTFAEWFKKRDEFTVQVPEDGEFIENYNPGIDIHIYGQHPSYFFHINRIDNYDTYLRIYTLLSLLFIEDDEYFKLEDVPEIDKLSHIENELENSVLASEVINSEKKDLSDEKYGDAEMGVMNDPFAESGTAANLSLKKGVNPNKTTVSSIPSWVMNDPFANPFNAINSGEVLPETAPRPIDVSTKAATGAEKPSKKRPKIMAAQIEEESVTPKDEMKLAMKREEQKIINPKSWFIKKLQEVDSRLFEFRTEDDDENGYSRKCAGYDDRQPSIMTKDQYERMRDIYENDSIFWVVYPLEGTTDPIPPVETEEIVTIMRYGSDSDNIHYYFCPQYYCLSDEIMIREVDFQSRTDREGNSKPANTCPFCYGSLITDRKKTIPGSTVIKRKDKKGSTYHSYVDFMTKSTHPENFALPCCFLKQSVLRISDPQFSHIRDQLKEIDIQENINEVLEEEQEEYEELIFRGDEAIEYAVLFEMIYKKYILESNTHPDPGIFATVPPIFDEFFRQNSGDKIVTRVAIRLKLRPNAQGFLRIGTENTIYESLLGVIAPLIYKNSINEVKERILEVMVPRIFLNSHFGNLVLEFFNPADGRAMPPTRQELMTWSQSNLGIALNSTNSYAILRVYNAYKRFKQFINDPTKRKDLRHIQPLLAEPGLFTPRGIQLIVMEDNNRELITMKCPTFGVSVDRNKKNDFAFISRSMKNIGSTDNTYARYELYIHTSNKPGRGGEGEVHETIIKWDYSSRRYWPEIVQSRVDEYMTQCQSRYRSLYTSQEDINSMAMLSLSKVVESSPIRPEGIIKDNYNHIVGVTFPAEEHTSSRSRPGSDAMIPLPVVDDGIISISSAFSIESIYLDWNDFRPAAIEDVIKYYKTQIESLFSLYPGYYIEHIVRQKMDNKIVAVQLKNGIYLPVAPPKDESVLDSFQLKTVMVTQFEWEINKQITGIEREVNMNNWNSFLGDAVIERKCGSNSELVRKSTYDQFEELYQQFRLMVANWITSFKAGSEVRKGIEDIIFNPDLPEYEKRKRLYLFLSSTLLSWFYLDDEDWEMPTLSFLRKDCRVIDGPEGCTGSCYWKEDENQEGKCLLHVHATTNLSEKNGEREVSTAELFTKRVIDELVRFPNRRRQLMKSGEISKVTKIIQPIRQDDQYIIPESSPTWTNLLRLDWTRQVPEEPKYYEEMSREETEDDKVAPQGDMPPELADLFGEDTQLRLKFSGIEDEKEPFKPFTGILGVTLEQLGIESDERILTRENLVNYVKVTAKPIGIINLTDESEESEEGNKIQFVRPAIGSFDRVTIFVIIPNKVGLLIQEDGNPMVELSLLPQVVQERWADAGIVQFRKKVPAIGEEVKLPKAPIIIGQNPVMERVIRRPLVVLAKEKEEPLIKAPKRVKPGVMSEFVPSSVARPTRRKPGMGVSSSSSSSSTPMGPIIGQANKNKTRRRPRVMEN